MPKFYKYNIEDLKKLQEEGCNHKTANRFRERHFYYTCSCCHNEELYVESPIIKDELWKEILKNLNIKDNEEIGHSNAYKLPEEKQYWSAVIFYRLFEQINKVEPDDSYVMLCRDCMEKGLGRELYAEDLKDCIMTKNIIHKFKNK